MAKVKYNSTKEEQKKSADEDLALKLAAEGALVLPLKKSFNQLSGDFVKQVSETGTIPSVIGFRNQVEDMLKTHYGVVTNKFNQQIMDKLGKPENYEKIKHSIDVSNAIHGNIHASKSSAQIAKTSLGNMQDVLKKTAMDAATAGVVLTSAQLAKQSQLKLDQTFDGRISGIAITETNNPAESAKQTEVETLHATSAAVVADQVTKKKWVAILDAVTRIAHAEADGQIQSYNDPYLVGEESLMYPTDTSLGASPSNTVNCRCESVFIIA